MLLDLLFKHIINVSVLLKGEIRRKMQLHLVLFALFIYTIFKEDKTYTSHVYPQPPPTGIAVE